MTISPQDSPIIHDDARIGPSWVLVSYPLLIVLSSQFPRDRWSCSLSYMVKRLWSNQRAAIDSEPILGINL